MKPWEVLRKREILDRRPWLSLEEHHVRLPNGDEIPDWLWVRTPDFINVAAVTEDGEWLCFRQNKYAVAGETLAIVGGYVEEGENLRTAAERELREETGYTSGDWIALGSYPIDGNRGCGAGHLYLAKNCRYSGKIDSDDLEEQELVRLTREEVRSALGNHRFGVMPWVAAVALALLET